MNGVVVLLCEIGLASCLLCMTLIGFCRFGNWLRRRLAKESAAGLGVALLFGAVATIEAQKTNSVNNSAGLMRLVRMSSIATDEDANESAGDDSQLARFDYIEKNSSNVVLGVAFPNASLACDLFGIFSATSLLGSTWNECIVQRVWPGMNYYEFAASVATNETQRFWTLETYEDSDGDGLTDVDERIRTLTSATEFDLGPRAEIPYGLQSSQVAQRSARLLSVSSSSPADSSLSFTREGTDDYYYNSNVWSYVDYYKAPTTGLYRVECRADDRLTLEINGLRLESRYNHRYVGASGEAFLERGRTYPISLEYENFGGPGDWFYSIVYTNAESACDCRIAIAVEPETMRLPCEITSESIAANLPRWTVSNACDDCDYLVTTNIEDTAVRFVLECDCGRTGEAACRYESNKPKDTGKECGCCSEGTLCEDKCVSFSQKFGRTPQIPDMPEGRLVIEESYPTVKLATPRVLRYDHPMMRKILSCNEYDAVIEDAMGNLTVYRDGAPSGITAGRESWLYHDGTNYIEKLASDLEVKYTGGKVCALRGEYGDWIPVSELGITVDTDADGTIRSVASVADGRMDISITETNRAWQVEWTSPYGNHVKTFSFTSENKKNFSLHEYRDEQFNFDYQWNYDDALGDWRFVKGTGAEARYESRESIYDASNGCWTVVTRIEDANSNEVSSVTEKLDFSAGSTKRVGRIEDDSPVYSATRDENGFIKSEIDERGKVTTYRRDRFGRIQSMSEDYVDGHVKTTTYRYPFGVYYGLSRRPLEKLVRIDGVTVEHELYGYERNRRTRVRLADGKERMSYTTYDDYGRRLLDVEESGRATEFSYDDLNLVWSETEGICTNGIFEIIDGKSTRRDWYSDEKGNVTNEVELAYVEGAWRDLNRKAMKYDASHRIVSTDYSSGLTNAASYICTGPVWTLDENGIVVSNDYNSVKALVKSTRYGPFGSRVTDYVYDAEGRVTNETVSAEGCLDAVTSRSYDGRGRIVARTDTAGATTTWNYSADNPVETETRADGGTVVTAYNTDGSLASVTGTAVVASFYSYGVTTNGWRWTEVRLASADSPRFERTYRNGFGEVVLIERSGFRGAVLCEEREYDDRGRMISKTVTGEPEEFYKYDEWGDLIKTTRTADDEDRYSEMNSRMSLVDGEVWEVSSATKSCSDADIAPLTMTKGTRLSGLTVTNIDERFAVDVRGNTNRQWAAFDLACRRRTIRTVAAGIGNLVTREICDGAEVRNISHGCVTNVILYDAMARETERIDGRGNGVYKHYDEQGRMDCETDRLGVVTRYGYDALGRVTTITDPLTNITLKAYDERGELIAEGGAAYPVEYEYDDFGNKILMRTFRDYANGVGDETRWLYDDASGVVTNKIYADGKGPAYLYDDNGRLTRRTWARGVMTFYAYDGWGNLTNTTYSDDTPSIVLTYDAMGRQTNAVDAAGITRFAYDAFGANTNETIHIEATLTNGVTCCYTNGIVRYWDVYGRDAGYALNGVRQTTIGYDEATGRIATMLAAGSTNVFRWSYLDGSDLKASLVYPNGLTASWSYDANGNLLQVCNATVTNVISQYDYSYDAVGRRIGCSHSGTAFDRADQISCQYNARSELTNAMSAVDADYNFAYAYDDIGNRRASAEQGTNCLYAVNELNQYTSISNLQHSALNFQAEFDDDGNQTLVKTATGVWRVFYNGENRPVLWTQGTNTTAMSYDRMGRRVTKNDRRFVYDGYLQVANYQLPSTIYQLPTAGCQLFLWDPTELVATRPLVWNNGDSDMYYAHDGNKNVSEAVFGCGVVAVHYEYAPFGAVTAQCGENAAANSWRLSSEYAEDETGTVYYNYRHYEPAAGRWMARDPIWEKGGLGLYCYIGNKAMCCIDSYGQDIWIENTTAARGFHYRICVDTWVPSSSGTCCRNGIQWKRSGKYCISFGSKSRFGSSAVSGQSGFSSGHNEPDSPFTQESAFPDGFVSDGDNGLVYIDSNDDPENAWSDVVGIVDYKKLDCDCDATVSDYFNGLVNKEATYSVFTQNCRDFSRDVFRRFSGGSCK